MWNPSRHVRPLGLGALLTLASLGLASTGCGVPKPQYVRFDAGAHAPRGDDDVMAIGAAYQLLRDDTGLHAGIIGHASSDGDHRTNELLSRRRADHVYDKLVERGILPSRLVLAARGEDAPLATNATEEGREHNRRVEIFFFRPVLGSLQKQYGGRIEVRVRATK
jgi:outer membrane protein OmpA-like peptidoglycan-associated protein